MEAGTKPLIHPRPLPQYTNVRYCMDGIAWMVYIAWTVLHGRYCMDCIAFIKHACEWTHARLYLDVACCSCHE